MKRRILLANLTMMIIAVTIPIAITDKYLRFARLPKNNSRVMLLSGGRLDSSGIGIRHYTPLSYLRHSAVYGSAIEYSYIFKTDRHGFRVTHECEAKGDLTAIAGDSFTEGTGSNYSWIERVQDRLCDQGHKSINVSIGGNGIEDMKDSLIYAHERLGAKKAIVAIIAEDIYRPRTSMVSNHICSMYASRECGRTTTWWHHPEGFNTRDLIEFANSKYDVGILSALGALKSQWRNSYKELTGYKRNEQPMIERSISAMESVASRYGAKNVSLFILPTKIDRNIIVSPKYNTRRRTDLHNFLSSIHIDIQVKDLRDCELDKRHFFPLDGHPNEKGHRRLGMCAST